MESSDLYNIRQQFTLGAYKSVANAPLPDHNAPDYETTILYQARAHIALNEFEKVDELIPGDTEALPLKAARSLARYIGAVSTGSESAKEMALEELRDLCVEIEGEEVEESVKGQVRVLAGTAFAREGEIEEALETLGADGSHENLESSSLIVQIYLSTNRPDLAKKEYERALRWAEDDTLLQFIEASIGLVTGADAYANSVSFYSEQLANPSLSSAKLLTARGVTRLLRGEVNESKSDLEEAAKGGDDEEALCASVVAAGLVGKKGEADELFSRFASEHPTHSLVRDVTSKARLFDECSSQFNVPAIATASA